MIKLNRLNRLNSMTIIILVISLATLIINAFAATPTINVVTATPTINALAKERFLMVLKKKASKSKSKPWVWSSFYNQQRLLEPFLEPGIESEGIFIGSKVISLAPNQVIKSKKSVFSFGFGGCMGVGLFRIAKDGTQKAAMNHCLPIDHGEQYQRMIVKLCNQLKQNSLLGEEEGQEGEEEIKVINEGEQLCAIILSPIIYKQNPLTKAWTIREPRHFVECAQIENTIKQCLGEQAVVIGELYQSGGSLGKPAGPGGRFENKIVQKAFEIVLSSNPEESYFQTKATGHKQQPFASILAKNNLISAD